LSTPATRYVPGVTVAAALATLRAIVRELEALPGREVEADVRDLRRAVERLCRAAGL
jgi:hypothetical protein